MSRNQLVNEKGVILVIFKASAITSGMAPADLLWVAVLLCGAWFKLNDFIRVALYLLFIGATFVIPGALYRCGNNK